jgi:hypothetical protein
LPLDLQNKLLDTLLIIDNEEIERGPWDNENVLFPEHHDVDDAIQSVITHIIELTPERGLIDVLPDGSIPGIGVIFDLAAILAERGIKVDDLDLLTAIAPYLPDLAGANIAAGSLISTQQYRAVLENLLEDLSPEQTEQALAIIAQSAIDRITDVITVGDFSLNTSPDQLLGELLDNVFGPVVGALEDVHGDREAAAVLLTQVLTTIVGIAPTPESKVAAAVINVGVELAIGKLTEASDPSLIARREAEVALIADAITEIYEEDELREQIGRIALQEWVEVTRHRLSGFGYTNTEIARVKRELEDAARTGEPLPADVFIKLPDVHLLTNSLEEEITLSPGKKASDG